ncbi:putative dihydrofolate synthetase [Ceratocystis lukuohia]|uniref:Dihydrofolate synthetase n=2 Tax=Ceratocystis TaxID=5157 RepID=A0A2C5VZA0_9PEZI|nr:Dihydrofolate synthetase [Ceratocystis fimbriata CBS 114723]
MAGRAQTIRLGLSRMERLYDANKQSWKAFHVAGTNGKGSICAYLSALCSSSNISHGRFTSPFVHHPSDSIHINGKPISVQEYLEHENFIRRLPGFNDDPPSPFEMMTLIAFRAFAENKVSYGVVETGMGGRLDSTNVMRKKSVNIFSRIDMDHNQFLGSNILAIAAEKSGIITTPGTPCIVDDTSDYHVLDVIAHKAQEMQAPLHLISDDTTLTSLLRRECPKHKFAPHEVTNLTCALLAFSKVFPNAFAMDDIPEILPKLARTRMPGRLQRLDISHRLPKRKAPILLDGAHNMAGVEALSTYVAHGLRNDEPVTWVVSLSSPRDEEALDLIRALVQDRDSIVFTEYGSRSTELERESRPPAISAKALKTRCERRILPEDRIHSEPDVTKALQLAANISQNGPMVVTGSLYLGSEILNWHKESE